MTVKLVGFDSECELKNNRMVPYCFQFYSPECGLQHIIFEPENLHYVFSRRTRSARFLSFNLEFDIAMLYQWLRDYDYKMRIRYKQSCLVSATLLRGKDAWKFWDLANIFHRFSLKRLGKVIGCPKLERPQCVLEARRPTPEEMPQFLAYAMRDAEICYRAGRWLINRFGFLSPTIASMGKRILFQQYLPKGVKLCEKKEVIQKILQSYRGGRVECFVRGAISDKIYGYDVNSMFPYVMWLHPYPLVFGHLQRKSNLDLEHEGVALCDVEVEYHPFPILGIKKECQDGMVKLVFPYGRFKGWFTYPELRLLEGLGLGRILKVYEAYETPYRGQIFRKFVEEFYRLRQTDKEYEVMYKLIMNSSYGRFAMRHPIVLLTLTPNGVERKTVSVDLRKTNPLIASYITAYARLHLWKLLRKLDPEKVIYCDTDSLFLLYRAFEPGEKLGELKLKTADDGLYIRSKFYVFGEEVKMKGNMIFMSPELVKELIRREKVQEELERMLRIREALRRKKLPYEYVKTIKCFSTAPDYKRIYERHIDGKQLLETCVLSQPMEVHDGG